MADNVDMPIYVLVVDNPYSMYLIEDKRGTLQEESASSSKWGDDKITVVLESKRDRIKGIPPPDNNYDFKERLVAVDSKLYRVGSVCHLPMVMDLGKDKLKWVRLLNETETETESIRALAKKDHYVTVNDRYVCLFDYENEMPETEEYCPNKFVPAIYVYYTVEDVFLPVGPVQGLPTDGVILPRPKITCIDLNEFIRDKAFLLQIGTHQGSPKLALVRQTVDNIPDDEGSCQLYCCKFVLHVQEDTDSSHPSFRAEILSNGIYNLGKGTSSVMDCTAAVRMPKGGSNKTETRTSLGNDEHAPLVWEGTKLRRMM